MTYETVHGDECDFPRSQHLPLGITPEQNAADIALLERVKREWREEGIL